MRAGRAFKILVFVFSAAMVACSGLDQPIRHEISDGKSKVKDGGADDAGPVPACVVPIDYHGGPVIQGTFNVYYIWYGNWSSNTAVDILTELASNIGGSPYYNINTTYYDTTGKHVKNDVQYAGSTNDLYSRGQAISDADVQNIVADAVSSARLPKDPNGVYFVLGSSDVNETSGLCVNYCGWHDHAAINGADLKYSFIGNPDRCPNECLTLNRASSPNDNVGADGMASIIAHELDGVASDPDKDAWYFSADHHENADQCAWQFGSTVTQPNGSQANVTLGSRNYLLQENWVNSGCGYCAISYP